MIMLLHARMPADIQWFCYLVRGEGEGDQVHGCLLEFAQSSEPLQRLNTQTHPIHVCERTSTLLILAGQMRYRVDSNSWIESLPSQIRPDRATNLCDAGQVDGLAARLAQLVAAVHPPVPHQLGRRDAVVGFHRQTPHDNFLHD